MPETGQAVRARRVLVVADDPRTRRLVRDALTGAGHQVLVARSGPEALGLLDAGIPDLMLSTVDSDELATWTRLHAVPCLPLTIDGTAEAAVAVEEILARVAAGPTPPGPPLPYPGTTLLTEARFVEELARAIERSGRSGRSGCVAALDLAERPSVAEQLGARADQDLRVQMSVLGAGAVEGSDRMALDTGGRLLVLLPETDPPEARQRLGRLSQRVGRGSFIAAGEPINVTTVVGFTRYGDDAVDPDVVLDRALAATVVAAERLDLQPVQWVPGYDLAADPAP